MDKENDPFIEIVKNKLANFTLPVDDDSWDKIAERLSPAPRKKMQRRWIAVIAVAASIALLFLIFSINKKTYPHETANQLSDHEKTIIQNVSEKEIVEQIPKRTVEGSTSFEKSRPGERLPENRLTTEVIFKEEITEEIAEENPSVPPEEESSAPEKQSIPVISYPDFGKEMKMPLIKHKKRQSIRFSFGSGGNFLAETGTNSSLENPNSDLSYFRAATQMATESRTEEILSYEYYPDVTHLPPLSFGVTVKKELNRTFAVESGIVYSYLATKFSRESPKSNADLQLHYIGIPLNLHTRIFGDHFSPWEVYLSTGGMIEKGFLSHFVQKTHYDTIDNAVVTVTSNEKIKGFQWSIGISPGVDYQIHKNYSIYLEPKVSYYFDNDQPESARTVHPVAVGINAGVRYTW